jgi:hypothetical protein
MMELLQDQKLEKIINSINLKFGRRTLTRWGGGTIDSRYTSEHLSNTTDDEYKRLKGFVEMKL